MKWKKLYFEPNGGYQEAIIEDRIGDLLLSAVATIIQWIAILGILFGTIFINAEGERSIITTFGKASETVYSAGMHVKLPFIQNVKRFDVKTIRADYKTQTYTKDIADIDAEIAELTKQIEAKRMDRQRLAQEQQNSSHSAERRLYYRFKCVELYHVRGWMDIGNFGLVYFIISVFCPDLVPVGYCPV